MASTKSQYEQDMTNLVNNMSTQQAKAASKAPSVSANTSPVPGSTIPKPQDIQKFIGTTDNGSHGAVITAPSNGSHGVTMASMPGSHPTANNDYTVLADKTTTSHAQDLQPFIGTTDSGSHGAVITAPSNGSHGTVITAMPGSHSTTEMGPPSAPKPFVADSTYGAIGRASEVASQSSVKPTTIASHKTSTTPHSSGAPISAAHSSEGPAVASAVPAAPPPPPSNVQGVSKEDLFNNPKDYDHIQKMDYTHDSPTKLPGDISAAPAPTGGTVGIVPDPATGKFEPTVISPGFKTSQDEVTTQAVAKAKDIVNNNTSLSAADDQALVDSITGASGGAPILPTSSAPVSPPAQPFNGMLAPVGNADEASFYSANGASGYPDPTPTPDNPAAKVSAASSHDETGGGFVSPSKESDSLPSNIPAYDPNSGVDPTTWAAISGQ